VGVADLWWRPRIFSRVEYLLVAYLWLKRCVLCVKGAAEWKHDVEYGSRRHHQRWDVWHRYSAGKETHEAYSCVKVQAYFQTWSWRL